MQEAIGSIRAMFRPSIVRHFARVLQSVDYSLRYGPLAHVGSESLVRSVSARPQCRACCVEVDMCAQLGIPDFGLKVFPNVDRWSIGDEKLLRFAGTAMDSIWSRIKLEFSGPHPWSARMVTVSTPTPTSLT